MRVSRTVLREAGVEMLRPTLHQISMVSGFRGKVPEDLGCDRTAQTNLAPAQSHAVGFSVIMGIVRTMMRSLATITDHDRIVSDDARPFPHDIPQCGESVEQFPIESVKSGFFGHYWRHHARVLSENCWIMGSHSHRFDSIRP